MNYKKLFQKHPELVTLCAVGMQDAEKISRGGYLSAELSVALRVAIRELKGYGYEESKETA